MTDTKKSLQPGEMTERKRLTLDLDPELHLRIKIAAAQAHLSMREYLEEILRDNVPLATPAAVAAHQPIAPEVVSMLRRTREEVSAGHILPDSTEIVRRMRDEQANGSQQ